MRLTAANDSCWILGDDATRRQTGPDHAAEGVSGGAPSAGRVSLTVKASRSLALPGGRALPRVSRARLDVVSSINDSHPCRQCP
jgi:hypothetical protein